MQINIESLGCRHVSRPWTIVDFVLVILGGYLGAGVFAAVGILAENDELFVVLGLAGQFAGNLFVLWILSRSKPPRSLGFEVYGRDSVYVFAGVGLQLALSIIFLPLALYLLPEGGPAQEIAVVLNNLTSEWAKISSLLISVVLAPITEELTFRGVLIKAMANRSNRTIILVSSFVFSLFHVLDLVAANFIEAALIVLPQLFIVGMILAWITLRSGRLGPAIFIHSGFNLLASLVLLLPADVLTA